jgi:hypothetical protein
MRELEHADQRRDPGTPRANAQEGEVATIAKRQTVLPNNNQESTNRRPGAESALFVAVVHAEDGVRFTATADSRRRLIHRICEHVERCGSYMLHPQHARHLRGLLARGEWEAAVELYFGLVGRRWDKEGLVTAVVPANNRRNAVAVVGEVAVEEACTLRLERTSRR